MSTKSSESIFELIRSLTKSEKRYFKLHASRHTIGEENNYVTLFDYIDKQATYDEAKLFEDFKGEAFLNKFSITKKRLYDQVLQALTLFHSSGNVEAQLYRQLQSASILFDKALYTQAKKILRSAEKLAIKHHLTNVLLEIRKQGKRLLEINNYFDVNIEELGLLEKTDAEFHAQSKVEDQLWILKSKIFHRLSHEGPARTEQDKAIYTQYFESFQKLALPKQLTFEAKYLTEHIKSAYYFAIHEPENSLMALRSNRELFIENENQRKTYPDRYISILTNLIYTCDQLELDTDAQEFLNELRKMHVDMKEDAMQDLRVKLFSTLASIELSFYTKRGNYHWLEKKLPGLESDIHEFDQEISTLRKAFIYFKLSSVQLVLGQYNSALKSIRMILNDSNLDKKEDIVSFSHILEILIQLELKNFDVIPHLVKSTQRFLQIRNRLGAAEKELLLGLQRISQTPHILDQREKWMNLLKTMEEKDQKSFFANDYFDLCLWIKSKGQNRSFIQLIQDENCPVKPAA